MCCSRFSRFARLSLFVVCLCFSFPLSTKAQVSPTADADTATGEPSEEGPRAALAFEQSYRAGQEDGKPVPLDACQNIRQLTDDFWSKKHVLTDFKQSRTAGQVGVIVIVKTEFCCDGSRLCAVTTACMEKKSTPLIDRFRVYAAWVKNSPGHEGGRRRQWDRAVIDEYGFVQGPGARVVVMIPTFDGQMYEWFSSAADLGLSLADFEHHQGQTPRLERWLAEAVKHAPSLAPASEPTSD